MTETIIGLSPGNQYKLHQVQIMCTYGGVLLINIMHLLLIYFAKLPEMFCNFIFIQKKKMERIDRSDYSG